MGTKRTDEGPEMMFGFGALSNYMGTNNSEIPCEHKPEYCQKNTGTSTKIVMSNK